MGSMRNAAALLLTAMMASSGPVAAQETDDWDFGHDPARRLTVAAVTFDNFGVAVRCMNGSFSVVMSGLPVASGERRLNYQIGETAVADSLWVSGPDSTSAFAVWPRSVATQFSQGGRLVVSAPDGENTRRYAVDLPPARTSVRNVFESCGRTLETSESDQPPDGEDFAGLVWRETPTIVHPGDDAFMRGIVALSCFVRANGTLRDCRVESEFPEDAGFGRAAQFGTHRSARVAAAQPGEPIEGKVVVFTNRFVPPSANNTRARSGLTRGRSD